MGKPASQIYARSLFALGHGCPLWVPEPNSELPPQYLANGMQIGDVGILRAEGKFAFLFNVCHSAQDPINQRGVPDGFKQLEWNRLLDRTDTIFRPNEPLVSGAAKKRALEIGGSASVPGAPIGAGAGFAFSFAQEEGAVLLPPHGADRVDCESSATFRRYAARHASDWYKYVNETREMDVGNGAIYLITGYDNTDAWENAIFSRDSRERMCELVVNTSTVGGADGRIRLSDSSLEASFFSRCSPSGNSRQNQTLFFRGFRVSRSGQRMRGLFGGLQYNMVVTGTDQSLKDVLGKKDGSFPFSTESSTSSSGSGSSPGSCRDGLESSSSDTAAGTPQDTAGSSPDTDISADDNTDSSMGEDDVILPQELYHPLQVINNHILQSRDVDTVITHDDNWIRLLTHEDIEIPDDFSLIRRFQDQFRTIVENGTAFIEPLARSESLGGLGSIVDEVVPTIKKPLSPPSSPSPGFSSSSLSNLTSPRSRRLSPPKRTSPYPLSRHDSPQLPTMSGIPHSSYATSTRVPHGVMDTRPSGGCGSMYRQHNMPNTYYPSPDPSPVPVSYGTTTMDWPQTQLSTSPMPTHTQPNLYTGVPAGYMSQAETYDNPNSVLSSMSGSPVDYYGFNMPQSNNHSTTRPSQAQSPVSNTNTDARALQHRIRQLEDAQRLDKERIRQLEAQLASGATLTPPGSAGVTPPSSTSFESSWRARTAARKHQFCSPNRAGNALCAWHDPRRERRAFPPRNAPLGFLNCGCTEEEALFEESLARNGVGSYLPGDSVRLDPALRNPLLKLLQRRYGYRDGDFERDSRTGDWVMGEGPGKWEQESGPVGNVRRPRNDRAR
ncbi:hypothetical protein V5O48_009708 [Marasmius crinis-equi]|uniref:Uncharacterized protein n=1 Tax=Marasmius crinis-equi TaxID=585013 RepID=A0ABR3FAH2_9AGAR